jgi:hypothetical protein
VVEGNSDILYKCCLIGAKKKLKLALSIVGYRSYIYICFLALHST